MPHFPTKIADETKTVIRNSAGSVFYLSTNVVASVITSTALDLTTLAAGGRLQVEDVILTTANGMAAGGGTVRIIKSGGSGTVAVLQIGTGDLGSNRTLNIAEQNTRLLNWGIIRAEDHTNEMGRTAILDQGYKLQVDLIGAAASGANNGTVRVLMKFRRIDDNATVSVKNAGALSPGL